MNKIEHCDGCRFLSKCTIQSGAVNYNNYYCNELSFDTKKLIEVSHPENVPVNTPPYCPLNKEDSTKLMEERRSIVKPKKSWSLLEGRIKFEDIKEGEVYHIPPYNGKKRQDILITNKTSYSASYRVINDRGYYTYDTLYPNTIAMRILTQHKIQKIEAKK